MFQIAEKIHTALKLRGHTKDSIRDVIRGLFLLPSCLFVCL